MEMETFLVENTYMIKSSNLSYNISPNQVVKVNCTHSSYPNAMIVVLELCIRAAQFLQVAIGYA
jgi:hypothetical protein